MVSFRYIGEAPEAGFILYFGVQFRPGEVAVLSDELAIRKARGNRFFEEVSGAAEPLSSSEPPKRRGRPPKPRDAQGNIIP